MSGKREWLPLAGLAVVGLLGLAIIASGQVGNPAATQEYETRLKKIDKNKVDDLCDLARWCYQNDLKDEARQLALEAAQKAPDDVRPKYILYAMATGGTAAAVEAGATEVKEPEPSITQTEIDQIYKTEGTPAMNGFLNVERMMMQKCGTLQCHGASDAKWVMLRKNTTSPKTIAENFRSVNKYVNRENAAESPILLKPLKGKDAGHPEVAFRGGTADPVYKAIFNWIGTLKTASRRIWEEAAKAPPPPPPPPAK